MACACKKQRPPRGGTGRCARRRRAMPSSKNGAAAAGPRAPIFRYLSDETGASASEYALMLMVLAGCGLVLLRHLGRSMGHVANVVGDAMSAR